MEAHRLVGQACVLWLVLNAFADSLYLSIIVSMQMEQSLSPSLTFIPRSSCTNLMNQFVFKQSINY